MSSPRVPDPRALASVERLCAIVDPEASGPEVDALFVAALREAVEWHRERSPFYRSLLGVWKGPESIDECARVPFVLASFFKRHEVLSIPREKVALHVTSSGTTGQKSQIFFDDWSIGAPTRMLDRIFEKNGWVTPDEPVNYLLFTYESGGDQKLGTAYTDYALCKYAPAREVFVAIGRDGKGGHEFDGRGTIRALETFAKSGAPTRIFGFPAFLHFTLEKMRALGKGPLRLHPGSLVFLGGGWKGHADQAIPKRELYARAAEQLGLPDERLRDGFGSVEHCIPYVECARHEFHVPTWSRVTIRDYRTLEALGHGKPGFLHFVSPYITSVPAISVLMGDRASLHPGSECGCGSEKPFFRVLGRAGVSKNRSCAIAAAELLR